MRRSLLRVTVYGLPLLLWITLAALAATELGSYKQSWDILQQTLSWLEPGFYRSDPQVISMYQLTQITRKLAHVVVYAILALLTIRLCQGGRSRLRGLSLIMAVVVSVAFLGTEIYLRLHQSEGTRHVRLEQFYLDLIGVGGVLIGTPLFFGLKTLERWLLTESRKPEPVSENHTAS
nr:VanZ family protein [Armatimonas sp.]